MRLLVPVIVVLLVACTGSPGSEGDAIIQPATERFAIVTLTSAPGRAADGALAQAYFLEHGPGDRAALMDFLNVPGAGVALDPSIAVDSCVVSHPETPGAAVLLDAGELAIEGEEGARILDSTYLPEGTMAVSGLAYEGRVPAQVVTVVSADGSDEVGPFAVTLTAPPPLRLLAVGGEPVKRGRVELGDIDTSGLAVAWEAPAEPYEAVLADEVAVVSYERKAYGDAWVVACAVKDDGRFVIPAAAIQALPDLGPDATDRVLVRRLAGASFAASGMADGLALAIAEDAAYVE